MRLRHFKQISDFGESSYYIIGKAVFFFARFKMAEQLSKVTSVQNNRNYCCGAFKVHATKRRKDLRLITAEQAKCNQSLVQVGMKICTNCRKQLQRTQCMVDEQPLENQHSEEEDNFVPPEIEFENLNETLGLIGESPLSQQKVKSRSRYLPQKRGECKTPLKESLMLHVAPLRH